MIVAIDGPAGAGKSSVARRLAHRLSFQFLDTGAMYRAVAWKGLKQEIDWHDDEALVRIAREIKIDFQDDQVIVDGEDVTAAIRSVEVSSHVHYPADNLEVRRILVEQQRQFARNHNTVTEGRDQGTVVFPDAECKIFLTASPDERARRRLTELTARGEQLTLDEVLLMQNLRDLRDTSREVGRLERAPDAAEFSTDGLTMEQVLDQLESIVRSRMHHSAPHSNAFSRT